MTRIAFIVNPVAGIGGPAGLAGSDGVDVQRLAKQLGSDARSAERAGQFLDGLGAGVEVAVTACGGMGQDVLAARGLSASEVVSAAADSSGSDTTQATRRAVQAGVDLVVFVGGDGTARDVLRGLDGASVPILGVPAGVKMHSSVFALSPPTGAALVNEWQPSLGTVAAEVADVDEEARREGVVVSRLYGEALVPAAPGRVQGGKVGAQVPSKGTADTLAAALRGLLDDDAAWVFGPGSTLAAVQDALGLESTLLGVDLALPGEREVLLGLSAPELVERTEGLRVQVVLSPIGGQGFLLGRGNQQVSAQLLRRVEPRDLIVAATSGKLAQLGGGPLLIDTGDSEQDSRFSGYTRIHTGPRDAAMLPVRAASSAS